MIHYVFDTPILNGHFFLFFQYYRRIKIYHIFFIIHVYCEPYVKQYILHKKFIKYSTQMMEYVKAHY